MRYLLSRVNYLEILNEELTFTRIKHPFEIVKLDSREATYTTVVDGIKYNIEFDKAFLDIYDNAWARGYDVFGNKEDYLQTNKNPLNIINAITCITEDFLNRNNVDVLVIQHINMDNEVVTDKINKRANINFKYLKDISGYKTKYFNVVYDVKSLQSICLLYRNDIDINLIIDYFNTLPGKHIEILP